MPSLSNILHRKSPAPEAQAKKDTAPDFEPPPGPPPGYNAANPSNRNAAQPTAPQYAPGTAPRAHDQTYQANNLGMAGGAVLGSASGGDPVMGMVAGQVGANMIAQRIHQEQTHQYYRGQAMNYRAGLPADGVQNAEGLAPPPVTGGRDRSRSRSKGRDERRKKRWERRAKRRDGGGGVGSSSGTDSN